MRSNTKTKKQALKNKKIISDRELRTMAEDIFSKLQTTGCKSNDIINVSSELIDLVTNQLKVSAATMERD